MLVSIYFEMLHFTWLDLPFTVVYMHSAPGAHISAAGHTFFRTCAPIYSLNYHCNILEECTGKVLGHSFNINAPERRMK